MTEDSWMGFALIAGCGVGVVHVSLGFGAALTVGAWGLGAFALIGGARMLSSRPAWLRSLALRWFDGDEAR